jgi:hypothetical protein
MPGTASSFTDGVSATASWKGFWHWVEGSRTGEDAQRPEAGAPSPKARSSCNVGPRVANRGGGVYWGPVFIRGRRAGRRRVDGGLLSVAISDYC